MEKTLQDIFINDTNRENNYLIVFAMIFKKTIFNTFMIGIIIVFNLFFIIMLSIFNISFAFAWTLPIAFFCADLLILQSGLLEYKNNKQFFQEKTTYNFIHLFVLFLANLIIMFTLMISVYIANILNRLPLYTFYTNNSVFTMGTGLSSINWFFLYYIAILLSIISFFYFEILYKFIHKQKNFLITTAALTIIYLILSVQTLLIDPLIIKVNVPNGGTTFDRINFDHSSLYWQYDPSSNKLLVYPFVRETQVNKPAIWFMIFDPLIIFSQLFQISSFNFDYTYPVFIYGNTTLIASDLVVKTAYFHIFPWSIYSWYMIFPYLYISFLVLIKLLINRVIKE